MIITADTTVTLLTDFLLDKALQHQINANVAHEVAVIYNNLDRPALACFARSVQGDQLSAKHQALLLANATV